MNYNSEGDTSAFPTTTPPKNLYLYEIRQCLLLCRLFGSGLFGGLFFELERGDLQLLADVRQQPLWR